MKVNLDITKDYEYDGNEKIEIILYHLSLTPENKEDQEKFKELEDDFHFEIFFSDDVITNKKHLNIIF